MMRVPLSSSRHAPRRRGVVLLLVVVIVTIAAMIGGTAAMATASERGAVTAARDLAQARAAAWSGVQAVMAELSEQREAILAGELPVVTESWELDAGTGGRRSVVRLVDLSADEGLLVPESGRLDVNIATKQMLVDAGIDDGLAGRIIAARDQKSFGSIEELRRVTGVTAAMLPGFAAAGMDDDAGLSRGGGTDAMVFGGSGGSGGAVGAGTPNLTELLTVFAFDPNIQSGLGERGEEFRGRQRVNLDQPWSDRLNDALVERFGEEAARGVERIMSEGTTFKTDKDVVVTLRRLNLQPETWGEILDIFTTSDDEYLIGRVDLRTAPEAVLAALPGVSAEQAREVVAARDRLAPEAMASATWLVTEGVLTPDDFESVVDHVTTRCMQWRVRVEGGLSFADGEESGIGGPVGGAGGGTGALDPDQALTPVVVLEAVVDISSQRVRVAYLRDVTLMATARAILGDPGLAEELGLEAGVPAETELGGSEELGGSRAVEPTEDNGADAEPGGEGAPTGGSRERGGDEDGTGFEPGGTPGRETSGGPGDGTGDATAGGAESDFKDRRIGRWTNRDADRGGGS